MRPQPVQRYGQQEDEGRVVPEQVPAHDGHERGVEAAEQPHALVEDAHVVPRGAVAVVDRHRQLPEPQGVGGDQDRHGEVGSSRVGAGPRAGSGAGVGRPGGRSTPARREGSDDGSRARRLAHRYDGWAMSVFSKILRAGEGKKVRALQALVPDINALETRDRGPERRGPGPPHGRVPGAAGAGRGPQRPAGRGIRHRAGGRPADHRPAPLRRAADGRRGPALRLDRRDEDRRGQDPGVDPARLPQRPGRRRASTWSRSTTTWPAGTPSGWARSTASSASTVGRVSPEIDDWQAKKDAYACDVTYGTNTEFGFDYLRDNMARSLEHMVQRGHRLRHRRRGRLDPHRRGPHPAHHLRPVVGFGPALLPVRRRGPLAHPGGRLRGRRGEADRRPDRGRASRRSSGPSASTTSTTWCRPTTCTS